MVRIGRKYVYLSEREFSRLLYNAGARIAVRIINIYRGNHTGTIYDPATGERLGGYYKDTRDTYRIRKDTFKRLAARVPTIGHRINIVLAEPGG